MPGQRFSVISWQMDESILPTQRSVSKIGSWRLVAAAAIATSGAAFQFGFQMAILNNGIGPMQKFINGSFIDNWDLVLNDSQMDLVWSWLVGSMMLASMFGSLFGFVLNIIGRRMGLIISGILFTLGAIPSVLAYPTNRFELLFVGRVIIGLTIGFSTVAQASYITEIAPSHLRGRMNSSIGFMIRGGYLLGTIAASHRLLGTDTLWVYIFAVEAAVSALSTLGAIFVCNETPPFLLFKNKEEEATKSIMMFHGKDIDVKASVSKCKEDVTMKKSVLSMGELLKTPIVRVSCFHACVLGIGSTMSGINGITTYSASLLAESGFSGDAIDVITIIMSLAGVLGCVVLGYFIETAGRRTLLLIGIVIILILDIACWILLVFVYESQQDGVVPSTALALTFAGVEIFFMFVFCACYGPVAQFIAVEMVPLEARSATQSIVSVFLYLGTYLSPILFIPLQGAIGGHAFSIFTIPTAFALVYVFLFIPETKNRSAAYVLKHIDAGSVFSWKKVQQSFVANRDRVTSIASSIIVG